MYTYTYLSNKVQWYYQQQIEDSLTSATNVYRDTRSPNQTQNPLTINQIDHMQLHFSQIGRKLELSRVTLGFENVENIWEYVSKYLPSKYKYNTYQPTIH